MANPVFKIEVQNLDKLQAAIRETPEIAKPILNQAMRMAVNTLAKYTTRDRVPWRTGRLTKSFIANYADLKATWRPTAKYAAAVEFGTGPHVIVPKKAKALFWPGADHPVKKVNHPGTKGKPYMDSIRQAAQGEINTIFEQALKKITQGIAQASQ